MNDKKPDITIVLPVHNRAGIVTDTLRSISLQQERPLSLIIVDNNSTDGTLDVVTRWAKSNEGNGLDITVMTETTPGAAAARNKGLEAVTTPYVMFFDSDDYMFSGHVKAFADAFRADPQLDIVGCDVLSTGLDGKDRILTFSDSDMMFRHSFNAILSTQRYAVRTSFIRDAGGWEPSALGWNDFELGFRLLVNRPKCKKLGNDITVIVRRLEESITGTSFSATPEKWEHSLDLCDSTLTRAGYGNVAIEMRRVVLAALYSREGSPSGDRLLKEVLRRQNAVSRRIMYRFAYRYTVIGGKGIHHLLRPFLKIFKDV